MVDLKTTDLELGRQLTVFTAVASTPHDRVSEGVDWVRSCVGQHARERCPQTVKGYTGLQFLDRTLMGEVNQGE